MFSISQRPNILFALLFFSALGMISLVLSRARSPHDGILKKAGSYYIEMKNVDKIFHAYLYDKKIKPVNAKDISCEVRFFMPDSTDLSIPMQFQKENEFMCESPGGYSSCKITFTIAGKYISTKFGAPTLVVLKK